jgi:hypothetical protein
VTLNSKLYSSKYLKYIVRLLTSDYVKENIYYHQECSKFLEIIQSKFLDLICDDSKLYTFNMELAKFITIKNADLYRKDVILKNEGDPNNILNLPSH